eukprot:1148544-Pelagomonas_calceolata.AAC.5
MSTQCDFCESYEEPRRLKVQQTKSIRIELALSVYGAVAVDNQLEMTTKRTIMENEQMSVELSYQSRQTEKLMSKNTARLLGLFGEALPSLLVRGSCLHARSQTCEQCNPQQSMRMKNRLPCYSKIKHSDVLVDENGDLRRQLGLSKQTEEELARRNNVYQRTIKSLVSGKMLHVFWPFCGQVNILVLVAVLTYAVPHSYFFALCCHSNVTGTQLCARAKGHDTFCVLCNDLQLSKLDEQGTAQESNVTIVKFGRNFNARLRMFKWRMLCAGTFGAIAALCHRCTDTAGSSQELLEICLLSWKSDEEGQRHEWRLRAFHLWMHSICRFAANGNICDHEASAKLFTFQTDASHDISSFPCSSCQLQLGFCLRQVLDARGSSFACVTGNRATFKSMFIAVHKVGYCTSCKPRLNLKYLCCDTASKMQGFMLLADEAHVYFPNQLRGGPVSWELGWSTCVLPCVSFPAHWLELLCACLECCSSCAYAFGLGARLELLFASVDACFPAYSNHTLSQISTLTSTLLITAHCTHSAKLQL